MLKLIFLLFFSISNVFAQDSIANREKIEKIRIKCANLKPENRLKFAKICDKAEKESKQQQIIDKYPFISTRFSTDYVFSDYEIHEKSTGARGTIVSKNNIKYNLKLVHHYSPGFKSYFGLGYQSLDMENTISKPLVNPDLNLWDFSLGAIFNPFEKTVLDIALVYGDVYYVRPYSSTNLKFTKQLVPQLQISLAYDLFSYGQIDFGLKGNIGYTPKFTSEDRDEVLGNFKADDSINYGGEIFARKQFEQWSLSGAIGINKKDLNTNYMDGELKEVNFGIKIAIPFGWNGDK